MRSPSLSAHRDNGRTVKARSNTPGPALFSNTHSARLARGRSLRTTRRYDKVIECITKPDVNIGTLFSSPDPCTSTNLHPTIADLRKLAWSGLPDELRPVAWPLLLGYLPLPASSRLQTLARKREEYASLVRLTFARGKDGLDQQIWHQIEIDVPRTRPGVRLWMEGATQRVRGLPILCVVQNN